MYLIAPRLRVIFRRLLSSRHACPSPCQTEFQCYNCIWNGRRYRVAHKMVWCRKRVKVGGNLSYSIANVSPRESLIRDWRALLRTTMRYSAGITRTWSANDNGGVDRRDLWFRPRKYAFKSEQV